MEFKQHPIFPKVYWCWDDKGHIGSIQFDEWTEQWYFHQECQDTLTPERYKEVYEFIKTLPII